ncbi:MAG: uroporphyrinogen decarboxylase [Halodesulfurarchaeum sp.]|nr:uroporphyrinogen decarboxylase [Halodesulfurarchaeum sp.]
MRELFLSAARGEATARPPVWLMRQAGRYLPEYRELRADYTFREAISTPSIAEEITLQPFERFALDAVVIYSDILVALEPMGIDYHLESGVGPVIDTPIEGPEAVPQSHEPVGTSLGYVGDLLERVSEQVGDQAATLGFAGGPFTLASYAVAGEPSKNHVPIRGFRAEHPDAFVELLERFTDVVLEFLQFQVEHGADAVQLFDTYAGLLGPADYREHLLPLHQQILSSVDVPTIFFVRNMGGRLPTLAESGADVVGLDWTVDMAEARSVLGDQPVQGNLDPTDLLGDPAFVERRTREVIEAAGPAGHILNLGHGIDRRTPVESVEAFVETAHSFEW